MNCAYCGQKFQADEDVVFIKIDEVLVHDGSCACEYVFEHHCSEPQSYIEYLEGEVL